MPGQILSLSRPSQTPAFSSTFWKGFQFAVQTQAETFIRIHCQPTKQQKLILPSQTHYNCFVSDKVLHTSVEGIQFTLTRVSTTHPSHRTNNWKQQQETEFKLDNVSIQILNNFIQKFYFDLFNSQNFPASLSSVYLQSLTS